MTVLPHHLVDPNGTQHPDKAEFRNYTDSPNHNRVSKFYYENHINQTFDFVMQKKEKFGKLDKIQMGIWDAIVLLNEFVDNSDPDTDAPQIMHLLQTAESIRKAYPEPEYDWFHLTGLIHDLGKVLGHPKLWEEPQWCVVGDTYPVGCKHSDSIVFNHFFEENPDSKNPKYNTQYGIYSEGIGLDNVHFSWGHDEYLYQVCKNNGSTLPEPAMYVIRYHSFYPWHTFGAYDYLCNDKDREMLKWVKEFQKHDLYSKLPEKPDVEKLTPYYKGLIAKYFPQTLRW